MEQAMSLIAEQIPVALNGIGCPVTPWASANQNAVPRIGFHLVAGGDNGNLKGAGPTRARYQIDCYARSQASASGLAASAKVALRAGMTIGQITDNPDNFEADIQLYTASFDIAAWAP
jgi:hypothetical protein